MLLWLWQENKYLNIHNFYGVKIKNFTFVSDFFFSQPQLLLEHLDGLNILEQSYYLLDEENFSFVSFDFFDFFKQPISAESLREIVYKKLFELKKDFTIPGKKYLIFIDEIFVNGENTDYILGKSGEIFFRVYIINLTLKCYNFFSQYYGKFENRKKFLFPTSFFTLFYLKKILKRQNFLLLYLNKDFVKLIDVKKGFFNEIKKLNWGYIELKKIYRENEIIKWRDKDPKEIEKNSVVQSLTKKSLDFYLNFLMKWLNSQNLFFKDMILISKSTENKYFTGYFSDYYAKHTSKFLIPFTSSSTLDDFGYKREGENLDIMCFLNYLKNGNKNGILENIV